MVNTEDEMKEVEWLKMNAEVCIDNEPDENRKVLLICELIRGLEARLSDDSRDTLHRCLGDRLLWNTWDGIIPDQKPAGVNHA